MGARIGRASDWELTICKPHGSTDSVKNVHRKSMLISAMKTVKALLLFGIGGVANTLLSLSKIVILCKLDWRGTNRAVHVGSLGNEWS